MAQKENQTAQKDVEEKRPKHPKMGSRNGESETLKRQWERLPSRNRFCTKRRKPQNRLGRRERNKTAGQNIEELQNHKIGSRQETAGCPASHQGCGSSRYCHNRKAEKNEERILVLGKRNAEIDEALGKLTIEALTQETLTLRNAYTLMVREMGDSSCQPDRRQTLSALWQRPILIIPTTDSLRKPPRNSRNSKVKEDLLKLQQKEEKDLSGERKQNDGEVQTLQKQQEKLSGEIATYEEEWKALIAQYPKI